MTKRILKFKRKEHGWYESRQFSLCESILNDYFDVEQQFDLHVSTRKPTDDDEYYVLQANGPKAQADLAEGFWCLIEGPDKGLSPTTGIMDEWLTSQFAGERVYVWAMG